MRNIFILLTLLVVSTSSPVAGQSRSLRGFDSIQMHPLEYQNGAVDINGFQRYLTTRLMQRGWRFISLAQATQSLDELSRNLSCTLNHSWADAFSNWAILQFYDRLGNLLVDIKQTGSEFTIKGDIEEALRNIVDRLTEMRPAFNESAVTDLTSMIPGLERHELTVQRMNELIEQRQLTHPLEGVWRSTRDGYEVGIVREPGLNEFVVVIFESSDNVLWQAGMVKARVTEAADGQTLLGEWRLWNHAQQNATARLEGGSLTFDISGPDGGPDTVQFVKLRPSLAAMALAPDSTARESAGSSGTAFLVDPGGLLLTANHVVEGARDISVSCAGSPFSQATLESSSASTDLALIRAQDLDANVYLTVSSRMPVLGEEVFTVGYPLVTVLGDEPKYTEGTVSSLSGPNGDASFLQVSVPVQPGNSGGPLVDADGNVLGVIIATASAPAFFKLSGSMPQNINWAVKGAFAAALYQSPEPLTTAGEVIEKVLQATCLIVVKK